MDLVCTLGLMDNGMKVTLNRIILMDKGNVVI